MKLLCTALTFLILIKSSAQDSYHHNGNNVFKVDSINHVVWAKDFSGKVVLQSPDSNIVCGLVFDKKFIFVWVLQGNSNTIGGTFYSSIHVLDTSGNLISRQCEIFQPANGIYANGFWPALKGGAWKAYDYSPGFTHHKYLSKVDSTGGYDQSWGIEFFNATYNNIDALLTMSDSTYLALADYWSPTGPVPMTIVCAKFNKAGHLIWNKKIEGVVYDENFTLKGAVTDSLNNIYLVGEYDSWSTSLKGIFAIKLNSSGQILHYFLYPDINLFSNVYTNVLSLHDSLLYFIYNDSIITFDTSFMNTCLNPAPNFQVNISSFQPFYNGPNGISYPVASNYMPDTISMNFTPINPQMQPFYCLSLNINEMDDNIVNFWPNPVENQITIKGSSAMKQISFLDLGGRLIKEIFFNYKISESTLKINFPNPAVYLMVVDFVDGKRVFKKIVCF